MKLFCTLIFCLLSIISWGQNDTPKSWIAQGDSLIDQVQFSNAITQFNKAAAQYKRTGNWEAFTVCKNKSALCYTRLGNYEEAWAILESDLEILKTHGKEKSSLAAMVYSEMGEIALHKADFEQALEQFEKEKSLLTEQSEKTILAHNLNQLGIVQGQIGNQDLAINYLKQALAINKEIGDQSKVAATYNDIGLLYSQTMPSEAAINYQKALDIYASEFGEEHASYLNTSDNLAIIYLKLDETEKALAIFEKVLAHRKKTYGNEHSTVAFSLSNMGQVFLDFGMPDSALAYQQQAVTIYQKIYGKHHPEIANTFNQIANIYRSKEAYSEAIIAVQNSLAANCKTFQAINEYSLPSPTAPCLNRQLLIVTLQLKAQLLTDRHYNASLKHPDLSNALKSLTTCDKVIEEQRHFLTNKKDKIALGTIAAEVYEDAIATAYNLAEVSFTHKKEYWETAYLFAEKSKAAVLLESMTDANAKQFSNLPEKIIKQEKRYINQLNELDQNLAKAKSEEAENSIREKLLMLRKQYTGFIIDIEQKYPDYYNLKYNIDMVSSTEIGSILDNKTLLISYFIAEASKQLYVFYVSEKKLEVRKVRLLPDFNRQITGFRKSTFFSVHDVFAYTSHTLYKQLFPKRISNKIKKIIVIPDGRLSVIPFEALITKKEKEPTDFSKYHYLVNKQSISYNFSSTLYYQTYSKSTNTPDSKPSILLTAPVNFDHQKRSLSTLPGTKEETNAIASLFNEKGYSATLKLEDEATESSLKDPSSTNSQFIHLATHGIVNEKQPSLSQIFLKNDSENDGNLYTGEIYSLNLNSKLVTLSACETGLGKISRGEGIVGLSRSLIFAGAQNIIVSFWSVSDASTSQLMIDFYKTYFTKNDNDMFDTSLRDVKLKMIREGKYASPYYWAPFVLIGL